MKSSLKLRCIAAKDRKDRKDKQHKLLSLCSLRSFAAKILLDLHDSPLLAAHKQKNFCGHLATSCR